MRRLVSLLALTIAAWMAAHGMADDRPAVQLKRDDAQGQLHVSIGDREAFVYQYGKDVDLPHYYPIYSPSGKLLTIQKTDPYPHHRSFWFADTAVTARSAPAGPTLRAASRSS